MPQTLAAAADYELVIKKSRFICCVQPMPDRSSAQAAVQTLWQQHPDAAHICWALIAGGQSAAVDDGEPSGTAGRPMLEVLRHQDLEGVLATVVRYFGGVKLGAGGLVRAYTDSVAQALLHAPKIALQRMATLQCSIPYALEGWLRRELDQAGAQLLDVRHQANVQMQWSLPESQSAALVARINDAGQGRIDWLKFWEP
jgi:uncharacterized YigZ family protein